MKPSSIYYKDEPASGANETPSRDEIPLADTWDLTLLYPTPEKWTEDFQSLQSSYTGLAKYKGCVGQSAQNWDKAEQEIRATQAKAEPKAETKPAAKAGSPPEVKPEHSHPIT